MTFEYKTNGVCSRRIFVELEGNVVKSVNFEGGCNGNTKGIAKLAEGMTVEEVVDRLTGIRCGFKGTSCPDQLAKAVALAYNNQQND